MCLSLASRLLCLSRCLSHARPLPHLPPGPARPAPQHPLGPQVSADAAPALDPRRPAPGHAAAPATLYPPPSDAQPVLQPTNSDGSAIPPPDPHAHYPSPYQQPYHAPQPHAPPTQVASPRTASPRLVTSPTAAAAGAGGAPPALYSDSMCRAGSGSVSGGGGGGCAAPECRICLLSESPHDLVSPCHCTGSLAYAHMACLRVSLGAEAGILGWGRTQDAREVGHRCVPHQRHLGRGWGRGPIGGRCAWSGSWLHRYVCCMPLRNRLC